MIGNIQSPTTQCKQIDINDVDEKPDQVCPDGCFLATSSLFDELSPQGIKPPGQAQWG